MHYGDKEQLEKNILEIIIYKHGICGETDDKYEIDLSSIRRCQYIRPWDMSRLLMDFQWRFKKEIDELEQEHFYLICVKDAGGYGDFKIKSIETLDDTLEDLDRLH